MWSAIKRMREYLKMSLKTIAKYNENVGKNLVEENGLLYNSTV